MMTHWYVTDPYFPAFHTRLHTCTGHNNDVNGPLYLNGDFHLFMHAAVIWPQSFPWLPHSEWNGAIGWGHVAILH